MIRVVAAVAVTAALMGGASIASAADGAKASPSNPVGWESTVTRSGAAPGTTGSTLDERQIAVVQQINTYFNALHALSGRFVQTDPDKTVTKGKVFVSRPGRFRFEYGAPSRKVVISDGRFLAIQDLDLNNEEVYEVDNTPFRLILRKDVDLLRDAQILFVEESAEILSVAVRDKDPDTPGAIRITLSRTPDVQLKEWVTRDAQGLETKVEVSSVERPDKLDPKLFVREGLFKKNLNPR